MLLRHSALVISLLALPACGGSSSETPFPLPPHPLNEPYRVGSAVETKKEAAAPAAEPMPVRSSPAGTGRAAGTWGSTAPEPLPELSPK